MIDKTKVYFFHNVYGDADSLIATKPDSVIAVPFGWTEEIEENRNNILSELGTGVGVLPCVIAWKNDEVVAEKLVNFLGERIVLPQHTIDGFWKEIPIGSWPQEDWTWDKINIELSKSL